MSGPRLAAPVEADPAGRFRDRLRADCAAHGAVLAYARLGDLLPEPAGGAPPPILPGRDRSPFVDLVDAGVRDRWIAGRTLLTRVAGAVLGRDPAGLEVAYGPTGRPYLRGRHQVDCCISHPGGPGGTSPAAGGDGLVVVGLTVRGLIGVHSERVGPPARQVALGGQPYPSLEPAAPTPLGTVTLTPLELVALAGVSEGERPAARARLTTLKGAYGQAVGQGAGALPEFGVGDARPFGVRRPDGTPGSGDEWTFATFPVAGEWVVSAAVYHTEPVRHRPRAAA